MERLVVDRLGEVETIEHLPFGHASVSFDVRLVDGREVIVRTNADVSVYRSTVRNLELLRNLGLPVPRVLDHDVSASRYPFAYMVCERFPGRDLGYELPSMTRDQMRAVAGEVTRAQRVVRPLPGSGYGYVGLGEPGYRDSWGEVVSDIMTLSERTLSPLFAPWADRVRRALGRAQRYFDSVPPTCFLDDLTTKNVIVEKGRLTGFVDFDCVCYGDPLLHLGLTQTAVVGDLQATSLQYVGELLEAAKVTAQDRVVIDLYSAVFAIEFLREQAEPDDRSARLLGKVDEWILVWEERGSTRRR